MHDSPEIAGRKHSAKRIGTLAKIGNVCWETFTGVVVIVALVTLKIRVERSTLGESIDLACYVSLQQFLSPPGENEDPPCQIINVDGIRPVPMILDGVEVSVTPRKRLTPLIEAAVKAEPKALGIDFDFSPWDGKPVTDEDSEILSEWKKMADAHHVQLFLAVQRARNAGHTGWLPDVALAGSAASITTHDKFVRYHVQWVSAPDSPDRLIGMGPALAGNRGVLDDASDQISNTLWQINMLTEEWEGMTWVSNAQYALTDYSFLPDLKRKVFSANEAATITANAGRLKGKIVLLGDAGLENGADTFVLPLLSDEPVPGVFLHACAALTEQQPPLRELTARGRILLDALLSGSILIVASIIRVWNVSRRAGNRLSPENVEALLFFLAAIFVIVGGLIVVRWTRLIWTDFGLVAIALLLHRWFHSFLHHAWTISLLVGKELGRIFRLSSGPTEKHTSKADCL